MQIETGSQPAGDQRTVFVIERDQVVRSALYYILKDLYRTYAFTSLDDVSTSVADEPDVILLGSTSWQTRSDTPGLAERFGDAAILIVVDKGIDVSARLWLERDIDGMICKPISFDTVCGAVERALGAPPLRDASPRLVPIALR